MKKLLFVFMLLPFIVFGQLDDNAPIWKRYTTQSPTLFVGSITPKHQLIISGENNKQLYFDFKGDSLKVSGNLDMDEAAIKFVKFLKQTYPQEIFRLNTDSTEITFNGNRYIKQNKR